jgi:hypothetical protein
MNDPALTVEIERIRLTGLEVTPERAGRIRAMAEVELQRLLRQERLPEGLSGGEVSRLDAPTMHVDGSHSDSQLASGLARSIARTLPGVESFGEK